MIVWRHRQQKKVSDMREQRAARGEVGVTWVLGGTSQGAGGPAPGSRRSSEGEAKARWGRELGALERWQGGKVDRNFHWRVGKKKL